MPLHVETSRFEKSRVTRHTLSLYISVQRSASRAIFAEGNEREKERGARISVGGYRFLLPFSSRLPSSFLFPPRANLTVLFRGKMTPRSAGDDGEKWQVGRYHRWKRGNVHYSVGVERFYRFHIAAASLRGIYRLSFFPTFVGIIGNISRGRKSYRDTRSIANNTSRPIHELRQRS